MGNMFENCKSIQNLDVSHFDTKKSTNMNEMFSRMDSLAHLNVSNLTSSNANTNKILNSNEFLSIKNLITTDKKIIEEYRRSSKRK